MPTQFPVLLCVFNVRAVFLPSQMSVLKGKVKWPIDLALQVKKQVDEDSRKLAKMQDDFFFTPIRRDFELRAIRADRVVIVWNVWRIGWEWISNVRVDGYSVSTQLPARGNLNSGPVRDVVIWFVKVYRTVAGFS